MPQPERTYRTIALDDHPMVIEGINHILTSLAGVSNEGITKASQMMELLGQGQCFDLFILDLELPDADGFEVISAIRRHCPAAAILIYTMHQEPWILARLVRLDIQGVVSKDNAVTVLVEAVEAIRRGGTWFDEAYLQQLQTHLSANDQVANSRGQAFTLTGREEEVLRCIARGLTTAQIAEELYLSKNTVGTYRRRLMTKFGTHNVAQLISKARRFLD